MRGLGDAILKGETLIGDEPFGVVLADDLCLGDGDGVLAQMVGLFKQYRCSIVAIEEVPAYQTASYGVIDGEMISDSLVRVTNMVEKPAPAAFRFLLEVWGVSAGSLGPPAAI